MKHVALVVLAVLALAALVTFGLESAPNPTALRPVAEANTAFGTSLYRQLRATEGNLFFSPYSISTALAMTYGGARGQTQREMAEILNFDMDQEKHHRAFSGLQSWMEAVQKKGAVRLSVANSLWCQRDEVFLKEFLGTMKRHYQAGLHSVDFARETEASRRAINTWVEKETERKIKDLIRPGVLDRYTRLVLCSAIYFRGNWASRFPEKRTKDADFFVTADRTVKVPMMTQKADFRWQKLDGLSAVDLPYKGGQLSMVVLLPAKADGLPELEATLTRDRLEGWMTKLDRGTSSEVVVSLPRFTTTCQFELSEALEAMGMPSAFSNADFSGMTEKPGLRITHVLHKAFVEVNEEGTEAAAATAVVMKRESIQCAFEFRADHPFLFLIREKQTGSVLFIGRISDPTK